MLHVTHTLPQEIIFLSAENAADNFSLSLSPASLEHKMPAIHTHAFHS